MKLKKLLSVLLALALLTALLPASALALVPDDEHIGEQWALEAIHAFEAWDLMPADAQPVTVAVLDGGFDLTHPDLAPNLYRDAAGNVVQFNAVDGLDTVFPSDHATHVAGIIAAVAGNGVGVAGVSGNFARILPVQVLSTLNGQGEDDMIAGGYRRVLDYAAAHPEANIRVINMSLGSYGLEDTEGAGALYSGLFREAYDRGILTVIAAGNEADIYEGAYPDGPLDYSELPLGVIALEQAEDGGDPVRKDWSNYNMPGQRTKDLAAPGIDILSTSWEDNMAFEQYAESFYELMDGTSQASPCVAGVAAMLFAANPNLTAGEAAEILCATARPIRTDEAAYVYGFSEEYGYGIVDAAAAVRAATAFLRGESELAAGDETALVPVTKGGAQEPAAWTWTSSDPAVAAVSADGVVTGISGGVVLITAASAEGTELVKRVAVYDARFEVPDEVRFDTALPLTFVSTPVRSEWRLAVEDAAAVLSTDAAVGGETVWLLPVEYGPITVTATLRTNERIRVQCTVEVPKMDISDMEITVENQLWTGEPLEPDPLITFPVVIPEEAGFTPWFDTWFLDRDDDYVLSWENNTDLGTGTVIATGVGDYTGTLRADFAIVTDAIAEEDVAVAVEPYTYDGTEHCPAVTVTHGGAVLTEDVDYTVTYWNNYYAGTASVEVQGIGAYAGTVVREYPIDRLDINTLEARPIPNYPYMNGVPMTPYPVLFSGFGEPAEKPPIPGLLTGLGELVPFHDYEISYENNTEPGTAAVTVTGVGAFTGTRTFTFGIRDKLITEDDVVFDIPEGGFVYSGEPYEPDFTVSYQGKVLTEGVDYVRTSDYRGNVNAGIGGLYLEPIGDYVGYFYPMFLAYGYVCGMFEIAPADIEEAELAPIAPRTGTGGAVEPDISATFNGKTLERDVDYELTYENNEAPGTATVTVTGIGNFTGSVTAEFTILDASYTDVPADAWYAPDVAYVTEAGLFEGFGDGTFGPNGEMSRAMAVQVLWKLAGMPGVNRYLPFDDVSGDDWFSEAVRWAFDRGIAEGDGEHFDPGAPVTREQFAAMMYRFLKAQGGGFEGLWAFQLDFSDAETVSDWAHEAMCWLVMNGVINGMDGALNPQGVLTRAQTAALLHRVADLPEGE